MGFDGVFVWVTPNPRRTLTFQDDPFCSPGGQKAPG